MEMPPRGRTRRPLTQQAAGAAAQGREERREGRWGAPWHRAQPPPRWGVEAWTPVENTIPPPPPSGDLPGVRQASTRVSVLPAAVPSRPARARRLAAAACSTGRRPCRRGLLHRPLRPAPQAAAERACVLVPATATQPIGRKSPGKKHKEKIHKPIK
jgi:hypothetical protein